MENLNSKKIPIEQYCLLNNINLEEVIDKYAKLYANLKAKKEFEIITKNKRKVYYQTNKKIRLIQQKIYRKINKKKIKSYEKNYRLKNKIKITLNYKKYRLLNPDKIKTYYQTYKEKVKQRNRFRFIDSYL